MSWTHNVAVECPYSRITRINPQNGVSIRRDDDCISAHGIGSVQSDGRIMEPSRAQ